jgi:chromate transporter
MRSSRPLGYFLDSVNVAAVAVMLAVLITMSIDTLISWQPILIASITALLVFVFKKKNVILLVLLGAILGYLLTFISF